MIRLLLAAVISAEISAELLDLTHGMDEHSPYWPNGQKPFALDVIADFAFLTDWYRGDDIQSGTHVGTHIDAPSHFSKDGWPVDQIPVANLFGPAVMIDIRAKASQDPDVMVTLQDVQDWEAANGRIPDKAIVFQCSGWSDKYDNLTDYFGGNYSDASQFHFPGFGIDAAEFLIDERDVVGLGVDTPSTDYGQSTSFPVHFYAAGHNVYGLENVKSPCSIPTKGATAVVAPAKLRGASGAATRISVMYNVEMQACNCQTNGTAGKKSQLKWLLVSVISGVLVAIAAHSVFSS